MTGENISGAVEQQNLSGTVEQPAVEPNVAVEFMSFLAEYNVVGMAVGLLVATKVGNLVKGIIEDFVTPLLFNPLFKKLRVNKLEELSWRGILYGKVLANLIDFLVTAFLVFLVIKYFGVVKK